jgi:hypothetical protein
LPLDSNRRPPEPHGPDGGSPDVESRGESGFLGGREVESRERVWGISHPLHTPGASSSERTGWPCAAIQGPHTPMGRTQTLSSRR